MVSLTSGIPDVQYTNTTNYPSADNIPRILKNGVLFFTGYPGSGKGTQAKQLVDRFKIRHLSTGELFRAEADKKSEIGLKMAEYMNAGSIIPKELVFSYLEMELAKPEYQQGFIIDGYPKSLAFYDHFMNILGRLGLKPLAAIHFDLPREDAVERLTGRLHCAGCNKDFHVTYLRPVRVGECDHCRTPLENRSDDTEEAITRRLDVFDRDTRPLLAKYEEQNLLTTINAAKPPHDVWSEIMTLISKVGVEQYQRSGSYYLRSPGGIEKSSVFHGHIDARSPEILRDIISRIEAISPSFQNKIYPVSFLQLGAQTEDPEFSGVYDELPNFHPIENAYDEAFSTHKMGDRDFDYPQIRATLEAAFTFPNQGVMTELEEEIFVADVNPATGEIKPTLDRGLTPNTINWSELPGWKEKMIPKIPTFELHHALDIPKLPNEETPPINLTLLTEWTKEQGLSTGGWFIFRKSDVWAYRSNEFSNQTYASDLERLKVQASRLRTLAIELLPTTREFTSGCSLEKVHAIWKVS